MRRTAEVAERDLDGERADGQRAVLLRREARGVHAPKTGALKNAKTKQNQRASDLKCTQKSSKAKKLPK